MDAVRLLFKDHGAYALENRGFVTTSSEPFPAPSVLVVPSLRFVPARAVVYSNLNVIYRDDQQCQYCGGHFPVDRLEIDHVIPRSRFAKVARQRHLSHMVTSWENCVAACSSCNRAKDDRLPGERSYTAEGVPYIVPSPLRKPHRPAFRPNIILSLEDASAKGWLPYLEPFAKSYVRLIVA
jgi:hypothetical protein